MFRRRELQVIIAGPVIVNALLGCGGEDDSTDDAAAPSTTATADTSAVEDMSGEEIAAAAQESLASLSSLRIQFDIAAAEGDLSADISLDRDGACTGTLGYSDQGSFEIVKIADDIWMKPDRAFWESQLPPEEVEAASQLIGDRYLTGPADHEMSGSLTEICNVDDLLDDQADLVEPDVEYSKGETTRVDGRDVAAVHWTDEEGEFTLYVDTGGEFYPVQLVNEGGDEPGTMSFSGFDEPVEPTAPAEEDVIDVSVLEELQGD